MCKVFYQESLCLLPKYVFENVAVYQTMVGYKNVFIKNKWELRNLWMQ